LVLHVCPVPRARVPLPFAFDVPGGVSPGERSPNACLTLD
jgi:hypothetical protein